MTYYEGFKKCSHVIIIKNGVSVYSLHVIHVNGSFEVIRFIDLLPIAQYMFFIDMLISFNMNQDTGTW